MFPPPTRREWPGPGQPRVGSPGPARPHAGLSGPARPHAGGPGLARPRADRPRSGPRASTPVLILLAAFLGIAVWWVGTHRYSDVAVAEDAGLAVAVRSTGLIAAGLRRAGPSVGSDVRAVLPVRHRADPRRPAARVRPAGGAGGVVIVTLVATAASLTVVGPACLVSDRLAFVHDDPGLALLLIVAVLGSALSACADVDLHQVGRPDRVALRHCGLSASRLLVLLLLAGPTTPHALFVAWVAPQTLLAAPSLGYLILRHPHRTPHGPTPHGPRPSSADQRGALALAVLCLGGIAATLGALAARGDLAGAGVGLAVLAALNADELSGNLRHPTPVAGGRQSDLSRPGRGVGAVLVSGWTLAAVSAPLLTAAFGMAYATVAGMPLRLLLLGEAARVAVWSIPRGADGRFRMPRPPSTHPSTPGS